MRAEQTMDNPGWRARVNEYSRLAGEAADQRRAPTREGLLDLVFEIRPVFTGPIPAGMEPLVPLQAEVMAAADDLRELLPGERGPGTGDFGLTQLSAQAGALPARAPGRVTV